MPGFASLLRLARAVRVASLNMCTDEYLLLLARAAGNCQRQPPVARPGDSSLWQLGQRFPGNREISKAP